MLKIQPPSRPSATYHAHINGRQAIIFPGGQHRDAILSLLQKKKAVTSYVDRMPTRHDIDIDIAAARLLVTGGGR